MPSSLPQSSGSMLVIIGIICLTIGYVFGWLISMMRPKDAKDKTEDRHENEAAQEPSSSNTILLKLWREPAQGKLLVELDSTMFEKSTSLAPEQRKRLQTTLREAAEWLGLYSQAAPATSSAVNNKQAGAIPVIPVTPLRAPSVIGGMTGAIADVLQPVSKNEPAKSIVGQIDDIVQKMLATTQYANENIFLAEDPKRGVVVRVGTQVYEGIGSVPEGEIKDLLKSAVAEWERQQENLRRRAV